MKLGAGGVILRGNETLLILRHNCPTFNNMWANPGGASKENEFPEQTAIRELEEELGIKTRIIKRLEDYVHLVDHKVEGIFSGYLVEIIEGTPKNMNPNKIKEIRYFQLDELPENVAPFTKRYLDVLVEQIEMQKHPQNAKYV